MLSRKQFLVTSATGLVTVTSGMIAGCGGGSNNSQSDAVSISTSFNGSLANATTTNPAPGAVFIGRATDFTLDFAGGDPPRQFNVALRRFLEPIGGQSFQTPSQRIEISQITSRSWRIARRDNFDLDSGGVYFLDLTASGGQQQRFVFIVGTTRAVTERPGTSGFLDDVNFNPDPGTYGITKSIGGQGFELDWSPSFPPPSEFTVRLRRYKERRGSDNGGDTEQAINLSKVRDYTYLVRRNSNFDLDGLAAYYLEIEAPGQGTIRAAFTTA
ncbi:MAG: hypothetical protein SFU56_08855 [Capsulimonadales bacterium]|nr:hypothetical protein [Capsulimonadales bacterium]